MREPCSMLAATLGALRDVARTDPDREVRLVEGHGPSVRSTCRAGHELLLHGWVPAHSTMPIARAITLADAAVRLEHTTAPAAITRWS